MPHLTLKEFPTADIVEDDDCGHDDGDVMWLWFQK